MSKTAIITIHGVADQKPGETARAVAALLHAYPQEGALYGGFVEEQINVPVEKLELPRATAAVAANSWFSWKGMKDRFDERAECLRSDRNEASQDASFHKDYIDKMESDANLEFMHGQVHAYDPRNPDDPDRENQTYRTIRLTSQRQGPDTSNAVDVYEMYWADLSRLGSGWFSVLSSFYQLIFHICSLGRDTLDFAKEEFLQPGWEWSFKWARRAHAAANFGLTLLAPILNLCLVAVLMLVLPAKIPVEYHHVAAISGAGAICGALLILARLSKYSRRQKDGIWWGAVVASVTIGIGFGIVICQNWKGSSSNPSNLWKVLALEWGAIATAGIAFLISRYSKSKPQAIDVGIICWMFTILPTLYQLVSLPDSENSHDGIARVAIHQGCLVFLGLVLSWIIIGGSLVVIWCFGLFRGGWNLKNGGEGTRKERSLGTAIISLMLPITLFAVVTITLYTPLLYLATKPVDQKKSDSECCCSDNPAEAILSLPDSRLQFSSKTHWVLNHLVISKLRPPEGEKLSKVPDWMFQHTVSPGFLWVLLIWFVAAAWAVNGFFWSAFVESQRPEPRDSDRSRYVGEKLSAGFASLRWVFLLLFLAFPWLIWFGSHLPGDNIWRAIVMGMGTGVVFLLMTGKLDTIVSKVWPPLDVILDVDNYLRTRPKNRNPKSRIATRYVSLLRFVAAQGYDKVVFVAHSQGTVITADLLRFLRRYPDKALKSLGLARPYAMTEPHAFPHMHLFTMGCPLRQLYGWRFPHLYQWSRHEGVTNGADGPANPTVIGSQCKPDPRELGVATWTNAYASGDYVGRHLWRDDNLGKPEYNAATLFTPWDGTPASESRDGTGENFTRREICYGVGAHVNYFQDNAKEISQLISEILK